MLKKHDLLENLIFIFLICLARRRLLRGVVEQTKQILRASPPKRELRTGSHRSSYRSRTLRRDARREQRGVAEEEQQETIEVAIEEGP